MRRITVSSSSSSRKSLSLGFVCRLYLFCNLSTPVPESTGIILTLPLWFNNLVSDGARVIIRMKAKESKGKGGCRQEKRKYGKGNDEKEKRKIKQSKKTTDS